TRRSAVEPASRPRARTVPSATRRPGTGDGPRARAGRSFGTGPPRPAGRVGRSTSLTRSTFSPAVVREGDPALVPRSPTEGPTCCTEPADQRSCSHAAPFYHGGYDGEAEITARGAWTEA